MRELLKTALFCAVAVLLAALAMTFDPERSTPEIFTDQGELFYPAFTDPQAPKIIEVIDYDESTATARPLKVEFKNRRWTLPSHYGYPADAETRLASTAAALMELKKDMIVSDRTEDQAKFGVIDPLDQNATSLTGRGQRVTLRDGNGTLLADFVIGKKAPDKAGYRYMRVPGSRRTYLVRTDAEVSSRFEDWIETDLLRIDASQLRKITVNSYSINETFGVLENVESVVLVKDGNRWALSGGGAPRKARVDELVNALDNLRIVDVQPKPRGLSQDLKTPEGIRLSPESMISLRQKGFFLTPFGQLLSNEGELLVETANGLQYTLRFGEVASGGLATSTSPSESSTPPADSTPEKEAKDQKEDKSDSDISLTERRYLFVTVSYSEERAQKYGGGTGRSLERELRNRFADWYYIISGVDFSKLRPRKRDLAGG
ncbi:MAG: DUF4340 domain-containing protein [Acidobacteriota bacterium]